MTKTDKNETITEPERLLLYQDQIDRIRDLKAGQRQIAYYAVMAQVGVVATSRLVDLGSDGTSILFALIVASFCWALYFINRSQHPIAKRRTALETLSQRPTKSFFEVRAQLRSERTGAPTKGQWAADKGILVGHFVVQAVAAFLAAWSVLYPIPQCLS